MGNEFSEDLFDSAEEDQMTLVGVVVRPDVRQALLLDAVELRTGSLWSCSPCQMSTSGWMSSKVEPFAARDRHPVPGRRADALSEGLDEVSPSASATSCRRRTSASEGGIDLESDRLSSRCGSTRGDPGHRPG